MTDSTDDIQEVPSTTPDFQTELARQLQQLAPETVADGKIDVKKLQDLLDLDATDDSERFGLFWPGKKRAMRAAQEPTTATLKPAKNESKDWDTTENIFIEGDNLETLKILQKYYHNKIKMIYIDPPYNTGKDFVYPDNYKEGLASYLEFTNQLDEGGKKVSTNSDTDGRYHSNWLNMIYPRLKLARNLMTDDGLIFVSIDDNEQENLRKVLNEIFGENNFVAQFIWKRRQNVDSRPKNGASTDHEYLICYSRQSGGSIRGADKDLTKYSNPDNDPKGNWMSADMTGLATIDQRPNLHYDLLDPSTGVTYACPPTGWRYEKKRMEAFISVGEVIFPKSVDGRPRRKKYFNDLTSDFTGYSTILNTAHNTQGTREVREIFDGKEYFDFPKPVDLIEEMVIQGTSNIPDSIVLDFFSGSGTTAHAVTRLNAKDGGTRRNIQVQLPEPIDERSEAYAAGYKTIADISKERIRRAGEKIKTDFADKIALRDTPLDTGFKVYKLADSNFTKWQSASETDKDSLQQHLLDIRESSNDAATEEELLTEVLLKQGISLTAKIKHEDISGLSVWNVGETTVLAYLNEHTKPSLDQLRAVAAAEPAKIIILEDAFKGDDELKTNLAQICKTNKIELWTV